MKALLSVSLLLLTASFARADEPSPEDAARGLALGTTQPADAAAIWKRAKLDPAAALELVRALKPKDPPQPGEQRVPLEGQPGRKSEALLFVPKEPAKDGRYGVLILLHGLGGNSESAFQAGVGFAPPHTIVIAPTALDPPKDAEDVRTARAFNVPILKRFKHWWSYRERALPLQALRHVRAHYPVDGARVVLVGYSMGGFGAWNLGLRFHDRFAGIAALAGGVSREEFVLGRDTLTRHLLRNAGMTPTFAVHGDSDSVVPVKFDRWSDEDLRGLGIGHVYREVKDGKHVLTDFLKGDALRDELRTWLGERRRDAHPARIEHHSIGSYHGGAYWLRIDEQGERARVVALVKKNKVNLLVEGVQKLTIFLDPQRFKTGKRVSVSVNGKALARGKVKPQLLAVAESFARAGDPEQTYSHALPLVVPQNLPKVPEAAWAQGRKKKARKP